jgi:hypothetical protein
MAGSNKIDSNVVGLRYQEEAAGCIGVPNVNNSWIPLEPNSYDDFGGEFTTVARNPINASRQRQKGVLVDLDAAGGFNSDLTQNGFQDLLQGYLFADFRRKSDVGVDRSPRRDGVQGEFEDYLITNIDGADTIRVDSRVAVSAAVVAGGTSGYAVGDVLELTDANATIESRWIVTGETGGVVDTVALTLDGFTGGLEGRTHTDTGIGTATTIVTGAGVGVVTLTVTYGNGISWQGGTVGIAGGDLIQMTGHNAAANNGVFRVEAVTDNLITTVETLTLDASPNAAATMTTVGFEGLAGDIDVLVTGNIATLTSTDVNFTTLGLIPGEFIFIGGDLASQAFTTQDAELNFVNNGWARIRTIAAGSMELDKTDFVMQTEASAAETIQLFFGRVLKNEADPALQRRRTYQLERTLGPPDPNLPAQLQAEYVEGAVPSELTLNFNTADKVTFDASFTGIDVTTIDGPTSLRAGTRPALVSSDAFNTSNDVSRVKLAVLDRTGVAAPTSLFAFVTEFTININNNVSPNKAIGTLGAFDVTVGQFIVEGSMTALFADVAATSSIRNNDDVTFDFALARGATGAKAGVAVDIPLITLGDGRLDVEQDSPITLPLDLPAAADREFDHTLLMTFFDFLPDRADT